MVGSRTTVNLGNQFPSHNKNVVPVNHICTFLHFSQTAYYSAQMEEGERTMVCSVYVCVCVCVFFFCCVYF